MVRNTESNLFYIKGIPYAFSAHLLGQFELRSDRAMIDTDWIRATISSPDWSEEISTYEIRYFRRISEFGNRLLRVAVNPSNVPCKIITAHFDRTSSRRKS